jgi:hypothetical protein
MTTVRPHRALPHGNSWWDKSPAEFKNRSLFYPMAGMDVRQPIISFLPHRINTFFFCDKNRRYDVRDALPVAQFDFKGFDNVLDAEIADQWGLSRADVTTMRWIATRSGQEFRTSYLKVDAQELMATLGTRGEQFGVFFYRGDSPGEGGSDVYLLQPPLLETTLSLIENNGVLVSDGSNAVPEFSVFHDQRPPIRKIRAMEDFEIFEHDFYCIGSCGYKYGPSIAWRVTNRQD